MAEPKEVFAWMPIAESHDPKVTLEDVMERHSVRLKIMMDLKIEDVTREYKVVSRSDRPYFIGDDIYGAIPLPARCHYFCMYSDLMVEPI